MAVITEPLLVAGIVFCLGMAALSLFPNAKGEAGEMDGKTVLRLLLGPACLGIVILVLEGVADNLYLLSSLRP